jgi:hypothetical protein
MRRKILIAVLALGTVGGYASGFAHLHHMHGRCAAFHAAHAAHCGDDAARAAPSDAPRRDEP